MEIKVNHPIIADQFSRIRQETTLNEFRDALEIISTLLAFPVLSELKTNNFVAKSVLNSEFSGSKLAQNIVFVPILRAGFGMIPAFIKLIPNAKIAPLGLKRNPDLSTSSYFSQLPAPNSNSVAIILDPILATGNSQITAIEYLIAAGYEKIVIATILVAQEGIEKIREKYPKIPIYYCQKDEKMNEKGYIIPGIGDAGDRFFGD
ncbi:uracil phosphoribosyltransferase [Mycoplasma sp. 'Moose RK']|uniref:uracil phosphoribosyltransferase n=1 Tax=Mycoplasma sp. 'Moose RK' TaxID=2780095 RepID=UPI0018C2A2A9|nr:uracil phosphoribosyltransferase [Mycoplasma sp. 'Moose RK']MBG0730868.1 uracil phosphoribosyltransferase [Mycoplasma sp. 'Moose RK']